MACWRLAEFLAAEAGVPGPLPPFSPGPIPPRSDGAAQVPWRSPGVVPRSPPPFWWPPTAPARVPRRSPGSTCRDCGLEVDTASAHGSRAPWLHPRSLSTAWIRPRSRRQDAEQAWRRPAEHSGDRVRERWRRHPPQTTVAAASSTDHSSGVLHGLQRRRRQSLGPADQDDGIGGVKSCDCIWFRVSVLTCFGHTCSIHGPTFTTLVPGPNNTVTCQVSRCISMCF
jgi:hypothetical protein